MNYDKEMQTYLETHAGEKLLLHCCCAPCASYCLETLSPHLTVTALFYNPNLDSGEEFARRREELLRFLNETGYADFADCSYSPEEFEEIAAGYEEAPEGGARCMRCFRLRLLRTAEEAVRGGYDVFATTLTLSPLKNAQAINAIGLEVGKMCGIKYLPTDFKKRGGYLRSVELSKEHHLYRQNYCGCKFSKR